MFETVAVAAGRVAIGSTRDAIDEAFTFWSSRLVDPAFVPRFRSWLIKEYPAHEVAVAAFVACVDPITNADALPWTDETGERIESITRGAQANHPAWGFTFEQATALAAWCAARDGVPWRLPTEVEWEWMARGPDHREYPYGAAFDPRAANSVESGIATTTPVGTYSPSWCGVRDLAGNVEEWTATRYAPYPGGEIVEDDLFRRFGTDYPIVRGGSFALGGDLTRCARRHGPHPKPELRVIGVRLVR